MVLAGSWGSGEEVPDLLSCARGSDLASPPTNLHFQFYAAAAAAAAAAAEGSAAEGAAAAEGGGAGGLRIIDIPAVDRLPESGELVAGCLPGCWAAQLPCDALPLPKLPRSLTATTSSITTHHAHMLYHAAPALPQSTRSWSGWCGSTACRWTNALPCCTRWVGGCMHGCVACSCAAWTRLTSCLGEPE